MASLPPPGTPAPDFTLPSRAGVDVTVLTGPDGIVQWSCAESTPSTRRQNQELLAQLEVHRRSA